MWTSPKLMLPVQIAWGMAHAPANGVLLSFLQAAGRGNNRDQHWSYTDVADWNKNVIDDFRAKGGKGIGHFGDKLLLLTTRGAKSGQTRTTPLVYHRDGERYVIAASK